MSWLCFVTGDAWMSIRKLDFDVQEAISDDLEDLVQEADGRFDFVQIVEVRFLSVDSVVRTANFEMSLNPASQVLTLLDVEVYDPP